MAQIVFVLITSFIITSVFSVPTQNPKESSDLVPTTLSSVITHTIADLLEVNETTDGLELYRTLHSVLVVPYSIVGKMLKDMIHFYDQRSIGELLSLSTIKSTINGLPLKVMKYWSSFIERELECIYRTICDMSAFISPRIPFWINQMVGIYFTTNSDKNMYFKALANGLINHNCMNSYPQCSSGAFFNRLASNVTEMITTTIYPISPSDITSL